MAAPTLAPVSGVPIVVGVTGHRDLRPEDVPHLEAAVRRVFDRLRASYRHTELVVVSPLAEGADRLVARVAVADEIRLVVPMPLELDDYLTDFTDEASVAEFHTLLSAAERQFVAPRADGGTMERPACYAHVGAYVAKHCHILLALWDGQETHKVGGTAEVVRQRREGMQSHSRNFVRLLDATDTGVIYHIVTPRLSNPSPHGVPFKMHPLPPSGLQSARQAQAAIDRISASTDAFNAICAAATMNDAAAREKSAGYLLSEHPTDALPADLHYIRSLYAAADVAAARYQVRTGRTLRTLFWLAFGFIFAFEMFAHSRGIAPAWVAQVLLVLYVALFGAGYLLHRWAAARQIDTRHLDYRALAESLRVEFYWRLAEVPALASDYCMRYRLEEMEWIRWALRASELHAPGIARDKTSEASAAAVRAVVKDWVHDQRDWFRRTAKREEHHLRRLERWTKTLLWAAIAAVFVVFVPTFLEDRWMHRSSDLAKDVAHMLIVATIGLTSAAAGLIHGYAEQRALSVHIRRYERMHLLFAEAVRLINEPLEREDWTAVRGVLADIGRESLAENADWVMLHRERPIELPGG